VRVKKVKEVLDEEGESKEVRKHDYGVVSAEACMAAGICNDERPSGPHGPVNVGPRYCSNASR
jgi:hypothetical protein